MVIPSYPKERTFEFKVDDDLITDSVKEILDGGRKVLVDVKARDESRPQPTTMDLVHRVLFESKIRIKADQRNDTLLPLSKEYSVFIDTVRERLNLGT